LSKIVEKIQKASHIVLISHPTPDADSIGSASAMYSFLLQNHKKVSWFCKSETISNKLSFMPWFENIRSSYPESADLAISLDCADKKRLGVDVECDLINIDHHATNTNYGDINLVKTGAISTTEILHDFFKENGAKINKKMATALYGGLLDDSGAFLGDEVDGTTFARVEELIECGADYKLCNKKIVKSVSLSALRLKAVMFKNMSLYLDARVALFCVSNEDMISTGAAPWECEAALEESLNLVNVEVALLLRENSDFTIKGSLRANSKFDCVKIAANFGGGGHAQRAGFNIDRILSLNDVRDEIVSLIKKEIV